MKKMASKNVILRNDENAYKKCHPEERSDEGSFREDPSLRSGWKNVQWTFFGHVLTR